MRSGVMRTSVRSRLLCRMISWPAVKGIRWVKPSSATVSPSWTCSAMAADSERKAVIRDTSLLHERLARGLERPAHGRGTEVPAHGMRAEVRALPTTRHEVHYTLKK